MNVEKAKITDAAQMHKLIIKFAAQGEMLPRALSENYENIRDYFVVRKDGKIIACVALHISWSDLAEVKALAVSSLRSQKKGLGARLVAACIEEADNWISRWSS